MAIHIGLHTLETITNNFSDDHKVGSGGYGDVYRGVYNSEVIAVKLLDSTKGINDEEFMNALSNHMKVNHPNIVRLVGYCNEETKKYVEQKDGPPVFGKHIYKVLCFEYMQGRSLDRRLSENSLGDEWRTHYQIIKGTCEGLCYLHTGCERPILHMDLKPNNILLDKHMKPKIADFGLPWIYTASGSHVIVDSASETMKYMPPELKHGNEMSEMTDVYSLGVTIMDIIRGCDGFELYEDLEATKFVEDVRTYWRERDSTSHLDQVQTCAKIAIRCVHPERKKRPTIKDIMASLNDMETQDLSSGRGSLEVVIVYAFDCTDSTTPAYYTLDDGVLWLVQEKLTHFVDSYLGTIRVELTSNTYKTDMKLVDSSETRATGYMDFERTSTCTKNMASGLAEAHKMISCRGHHNGIILFFSDGLINKGDFFDGTENFISKVPVHTFTLAEGPYNHVLHSIAANSPGGKFHTTPVPERPTPSTPFSKLLDSLLGENPKDDDKLPSPISGRGPLDVVIVYAFDCTDRTTPTFYTVDDEVFWLVQEKLTQFVGSCLGYVCVELISNTYITDMKLVDSTETRATGYADFGRTSTCTKRMASGLAEAHKMLSYRGHCNGIILLFSDGLINKGDFFDGTENFISKVPVHTFTLAKGPYNHVLRSIAANSPGGKFHPTVVPERPNLSASFLKLLDSLLVEMDLDIVFDAHSETELLNIHKLHSPLELNNLTPTVFKLEFLKTITSDFSTTSELGKGGYGVVYKGVFPSGEIIAVKKLESHLVKDEEFQREVSFLAGIKHQNVVQIVGYCAESSWELRPQPIGGPIWPELPNRLICLEYVCKGGLNNYISDESKGLEWNMRYDIIKGICSGLNFLHGKDRAHMDLKPENILMDAAMVPKIADFGLSRIFHNQETRIITHNRPGTRGYMAPEYIFHGIISNKADIFSLGVIIIQIVTGCTQYPLSSAYLKFFNADYCPQSSDTTFHDFIQKVLGRWRTKFMSMPKHKSMEKYTQQVKQCITMALKCVDPDREKRPTAKDIIQGLTAADQEDLSPRYLSDSSAGHQNNQEATKTSREAQSVTGQTT